ncbi:hypothetical protein ACFQ5N_14050 [Lutibacter holmesii]|uniref:Uncharacterized protein n=1 Tax=Lutibacter holmesii TaxID=1137985 RepID=A0ABW3WSV1_9FLAO
MKKFRTHLIVDLKDSTIIENLIFEYMELLLLTESSNSFFSSKDGMRQSFYTYGKSTEDITPNDDIPLNELIIIADNEEKAEDLLSLIHCGILLAYPEPGLTNNFTFLKEYKESENEWYKEKPFIKHYQKIENIGFGCIVANKAIKSKQLCYAIEKYKVSLDLNSFTPHSANPRYGQVFEHYDVKHNYHTRGAFAIISAFSVIEELELEIRSSNKNPRFLNTETGEWNPKVLENIEKRLEKSEIDSKLTFDWIYRGNPTRIEQDIKPFFGFDSEWVKYGAEVRDKTLTIPEAIHNVSYLRNFIAAHKFRELTQYISPYDIFNTQTLARLLILRKMKLWETMLE